MYAAPRMTATSLRTTAGASRPRPAALGPGRSLLGALAAVLSYAGPALAEDSPFGVEERKPVVYDVDGWELRPLVEVRVRGEYHVFPVHDGKFTQVPVLAARDGALGRSADDQILVWERVRLGLGVKKGPVLAQVTLQDVRAIGEPMQGRRIAGQPDLPITEPYEAYLDVATDDRDLFFRLGRQELVVGDGRLVGRSDDYAPGRTFDAARLAGRIGDFDLQAFAAMLVLPGDKQLPAGAPEGADPAWGAGAQLYGLDATWRAAPYLGAELTALARLVREPLVSDVLTPSDVGVLAARVFGDYRGVRYSALGAFEAGRIAELGVEDNRLLVAGAAAARVEWETALPWRLTFGAQGAYASGGSERGDTVIRADGQAVNLGTSHAFDPIYPDSTAHFGPAGFYALSNLLEVGADASARPLDELLFRLTYRLVGSPSAGMWHTASLFPVGAHDAGILGHVAGFDFRARPWEWLDVGASYWIMVHHDVALDAQVGRSASAPDFSELALLDARLLLP